jgi:HAD superfamily hydrolase (TIGR01490 family)
MKLSHPYVVFFDLDKTLTGTNSGQALVRMAYDKGILGKKDLTGPLLMLILYKAGITPAERIITSLGQKLRGTDDIIFEELAAEAFDKYLIGSIFQAAKEEIAIHREKNALLVILSSAVEGICNAVARHLSIDKVICTVMEKNNGKLTGSPSGNYCYGEEKRRRMSEFCINNEYDTEKAFYYADSFSDIEALKVVGNPVCINPDSRLRSYALKRGWQVRLWS